MFTNKDEIEKVLNALSEQLQAQGVTGLEIVVCGGAALNILGYVSRITQDVDVIALVDKERGSLSKASPLASSIVEAAKRVQKDFNLPENWLNAEPSGVMDFGLPKGLMDRVETRKYGKSLTVHFLTRYDQIHFKLHATIDRGFGKHYDDLMALKPTSQELEEAARWSMTHDVSEPYRLVLKDFLDKIGHKNVADKL